MFLEKRQFFSFDCLMQVMKYIVDKQWQNNFLIFSRVKQWLSFFKFNFPASAKKVFEVFSVSLQRILFFL